MRGRPTGAAGLFPISYPEINAVNRREARKEFKTRKTPKGIYAVRCAGTAQTWVDSSTHLDSARNSLWFQLRGGAVLNKALQTAWNVYGEAAFEFQILETLDEDAAPPAFLKDVLSERLTHWQKALAAARV